MQYAHIPIIVFAAPPEDEQVVLKTCRGKGKAIPFTGLDRP
jgi:hypothetical protein